MSMSVSQVRAPYAILNPLASGVKLRKNLYLKHRNLTPIQVQKIIRQATANSTTPVMIDLETTSACAHDRNANVVAVSLASNHSVVSINVKDKPDVWISILNYLHATQIPLMAHNAVFDMAWMLRDFNPTARYYADYKLFNFVGCTYGMYRHLASEGFYCQKWSLEYATESLLKTPSNKRERNKQLVSQGIIKKPVKSEVLLKLCNGDEVQYKEYLELVQHKLDLSKPEDDGDNEDATT